MVVLATACVRDGGDPLGYSVPACGCMEEREGKRHELFVANGRLVQRAGARKAAKIGAKFDLHVLVVQSELCIFLLSSLQREAELMARTQGHRAHH